jgi:hypothetical protein
MGTPFAAAPRRTSKVREAHAWADLEVLLPAILLSRMRAADPAPTAARAVP